MCALPPPPSSLWSTSSSSPRGHIAGCLFDSLKIRLQSKFEYVYMTVAYMSRDRWLLESISQNFKNSSHRRLLLVRLSLELDPVT